MLQYLTKTEEAKRSLERVERREVARTLLFNMLEEDVLAAPPLPRDMRREVPIAMPITNAILMHFQALPRSQACA